MTNSDMSFDQIKRDILDSCSETTTGSWELWWGRKPKDPSTENELKKMFVDAIDELVREKKLAVLHYGPWASPDAVYVNANYDRQRLEYEIDHSLRETGLDPDKHYWFELTKSGRETIEQLWRKERARLSMYVLLGLATATKSNKTYQAGEKHAVLAYAQASKHLIAERIIRNELAKLGWEGLVTDRIGTIDPSIKKGDDSINAALENGFSAVIYKETEL